MYKEVRRQQHRSAELNRKRRASFSTDPHYESGDVIILWQPQQRAISHRSPVTAKWTYRWTGPHKIVQKDGKTSYKVHDGRTGLMHVRCSVRSLHPYFQWSQTIPSTSPDYDQSYPFIVGGRIPKGSLIVIGLDTDEGTYAIGQLLDKDEGGNLRFQWLSNKTHNLKGTVCSRAYREPLY